MGPDLRQRARPRARTAQARPCRSSSSWRPRSGVRFRASPHAPSARGRAVRRRRAPGRGARAGSTNPTGTRPGDLRVVRRRASSCCDGARARRRRRGASAGCSPRRAAATAIESRHGTLRREDDGVGSARRAVARPPGAHDRTPRSRSRSGCAPRREIDDDLLVVDGPLRGRQHLPRTVGMVKTHNVTYLPPEQNRVVGRAARPASARRSSRSAPAGAGTRGTSACPAARTRRGPESSGARRRPTSRRPRSSRSADTTAIVLPQFASEPYKDARAPQNLYPIGGLERELRRRLGDSELLYRALRTVARQSAPDPNRGLAANHVGA